MNEREKASAANRAASSSCAWVVLHARTLPLPKNRPIASSWTRPAAMAARRAPPKSANSAVRSRFRSSSARSFQTIAASPPRPQDAKRLGAERQRVEPVEGLRGRHEVDAGVGHCGGLCRPVRAAIPRLAPQQGVGGLAHRVVRFHCDHPVAAVQPAAGEQPGAGADVGDRQHGTATDQALDVLIERGRVARPGTLVVVRLTVEHALHAACFGEGRGKRRALGHRFALRRAHRLRCLSRRLCSRFQSFSACTSRFSNCRFPLPRPISSLMRPLT